MTFEDAFELFTEIHNLNLMPGETVYLIPSEWWESFQEFSSSYSSSSSSSSPLHPFRPPFDPSELADEENPILLRKDANFSSDIFITSDLYLKIKEMFPSPIPIKYEFPRKVITRNGQPVVETRPVLVKCSINAYQDIGTISMLLSRAYTASQVFDEVISTAMSLHPSKTREKNESTNEATSTVLSLSRSNSRLFVLHFHEPEQTENINMFDNENDNTVKNKDANDYNNDDKIGDHSSTRSHLVSKLPNSLLSSQSIKGMSLFTNPTTLEEIAKNSHIVSLIIDTKNENGKWDKMMTESTPFNLSTSNYFESTSLETQTDFDTLTHQNFRDTLSLYKCVSLNFGYNSTSNGWISNLDYLENPPLLEILYKESTLATLGSKLENYVYKVLKTDTSDIRIKAAGSSGKIDNVSALSADTISKLAQQARIEMALAENLRVPDDANLSPDSDPKELDKPTSLFGSALANILTVASKIPKIWQAGSSSLMPLSALPERRITRSGGGGGYDRDRERDDSTYDKANEATRAQEQFDYYMKRSYYYSDHERDTRFQPGICGLQNLGNTCFMNSIVQCLAATEKFTEFFIGENPAYIAFINPHPLSSKGQLAHAFGALIRTMWTGGFRCVSPGPLKRFLADCASQFTGFSQHDCQEFMSFLLDNLLEDLCRVQWPKPKGLPPLPSTETEQAQALNTWTDYLARNASIVTDVFSGQFRSKLTCNECDFVSIAFDPFTSVSVPVPTLPIIPKVSVIFFPDGMEPCFVTFLVPPIGTRFTPLDIAKKAIQIVYYESSIEMKKLDKTPDPFEIHVSVISDESKHSIEIQALPFDCDAMDMYYKTPFRNKNYHFFLRTVLSRRLPLLPEHFPQHFLPPKFILPPLVPFGGDKKRLKTENLSFLESSSSSSSSSLLTMNNELTVENEVKVEVSVTFGDKTAEEIRTHKQHKTSSSSSSKKRPSSPTHDSHEHHINKTIADPELMSSSSTSSSSSSSSSSHPTLVPGVDFIQVALQRQAEFPSYNKELFDFGDVHLLSLGVVNGLPLQEGQIISNEQVHSEIRRRFHALIMNDVQFTLFLKTFDRKTKKVMKEVILPNTSSPLQLQSEFFQLLCVIFTSEFYQKVNRRHNDWVHFYKRLIGKETKESNDKKKSLTLQDCLTAFSTREQLGKDDTWYCSQCKKHVQAFKEMKLWRLPETFIVHLKRFKVKTLSLTSFYNNVSKISSHIEYPLELNLEEFLSEGAPGASLISNSSGVRSPMYDLFGVSLHSGGPSGGHYWAQAFNYRTKQWCDFNDSSATIMKDVPKSATDAYVLFYRRRNEGEAPISSATTTLSGAEVFSSVAASRAEASTSVAAGGESVSSEFSHIAHDGHSIDKEDDMDSAFNFEDEDEEDLQHRYPMNDDFDYDLSRRR
jgi:ubiquitin C-terminal hydrolase